MEKPERDGRHGRGVLRRAPVYISNEFKAAVERLSSELGLSHGLVVERALLQYMSGLNGQGDAALGEVEAVKVYADAPPGYTPRHGGDEWRALVERWGPAPYSPRSKFRWRSGPTAERMASAGVALHCLWCDAHTATGGEKIEHRADCPTLDD